MTVFRQAAPVALAPRCPRDGRELDAQELESVELWACARCSGVWLDTAALVGLLADKHRMDGLALHPLATAERKQGADEGRPLPCCRCQKPSTRREYGQGSKVIVDVCEEHGIWLDGGELHAVIRYARGHARPLHPKTPDAERKALRGMPRRPPGHVPSKRSDLMELLVRLMRQNSRTLDWLASWFD